jgi:hypothetical protein
LPPVSTSPAANSPMLSGDTGSAPWAANISTNFWKNLVALSLCPWSSYIRRQQFFPAFITFILFFSHLFTLLERKVFITLQIIFCNTIYSPLSPFLVPPTPAPPRPRL